jgi:hypothetical protein
MRRHVADKGLATFPPEGRERLTAVLAWMNLIVIS